MSVLSGPSEKSSQTHVTFATRPWNAEHKNEVAVLKESRVIGHIPYYLANTENRTGIVTRFISKPTNQGSVEVCGKAVNRSGGLLIYGKGPCLYFWWSSETRGFTSTITRRWQQPRNTERRLMLIAASKGRERERSRQAMTAVKGSETFV